MTRKEGRQDGQKKERKKAGRESRKEGKRKKVRKRRREEGRKKMRRADRWKEIRLLTNLQKVVLKILFLIIYSLI